MVTNRVTCCVLSNSVPTSKVDRIKKGYFLPNYVAKIVSKPMKRIDGYFITFCPFCQQNEDKWRKRSFWVNESVCGCFNPKCSQNSKPMDIINFYARYHNVTNEQAISDLFTGIR